jgi:lipopolysaccharide assembly outer membrane protein LptD (OstA)
LRYITADNITTFDPNQGRFQASYSNVGITDRRGDRLYLEHIWQDKIQEQINGNIRIKIFPFLDVSYGKRYSRDANQALETTYGLYYLHQCWGVDLLYTEKPEIAGAPAENKILFMLSLKGVTSVGR